ncbi:1-acyl-sn-glycerol-3-phosphate acyltransferase [Mobilisporobacter senegalensis]|uniref:1-acyl-sn-glycerol-3-phosphate acyltransferase n=1 Tax=Mobilisporobacter senegalensis TaxID=1329262 RepID=A0A3N1XYR6_9FIRM|nr:lysophospholipid acyltransferase family protein [Mobilisporobacter senegalensis]ROR31719.1 1-acyl-sn-glycerol-3-phosphate acyltransferase [Mobilisporobacter senegalensis]
MKRIALMVLKLLYYIPYLFFKLHQLSNIEKYDEETRYAFVRKVAIKANRKGRVTIASFGESNLPKENGYIMFPNHQGLFDALSFLESHKRPFSVVMKKEVKDTILLKQIIQVLQAQIIDREDVRQSMKVIMNMTKEVKMGRNYIIFAEGTRSKKQNEILEFKGGSFKSAMNAKCPIVPVALIDSFKAFDTNSIEKVTVQIHYLKPLYYEEYAGLKSTEIARIVEDRIKLTIAKYTK